MVEGMSRRREAALNLSVGTRERYQRRSKYHTTNWYVARRAKLGLAETIGSRDHIPVSPKGLALVDRWARGQVEPEMTGAVD